MYGDSKKNILKLHQKKIGQIQEPSNKVKEWMWGE
jgi:hypothetical protein